MLILTRRIGETVIIADNIRVTVTAVNGQQVRIGIDAPKQLSILREELVGTPCEIKRGAA